MADLGTDKKNEKLIDLVNIFLVLWRRKLFISLFIIFSGIISIFYSLSLQNYYKSEALLAAVDSNQATTSSQFSGIASLAGFSLGSSGENKAVLAVEMIKSKEFLRILLQNEGILQGILASENYDKDTGHLTYKDSLYNEKNNTWSDQGDFIDGYKPSHIKAYPTYIEHLYVKKDRSTDLITLSYEHISPLFSKQILDLIISQVNETARSKDKDEYENKLKFLEDKFETNNLTEMRESLIALMESELQKLMLVDAKPEYLLEIIDKPFFPELRVRPNRILICIMGVLLGALFSMSYVLFSNSIKDRRS